MIRKAVTTQEPELEAQGQFMHPSSPAQQHENRNARPESGPAIQPAKQQQQQRMSSRSKQSSRVEQLASVISLTIGVAAVWTLAACGNTPNRAPVEERSASSRSAPAPAWAASSASAATADLPAKPLPGAENAGKPGYYTVKPGDTLIRVGLESGQNWRDLVRWNNLDNPNVIEVGQVLRVVPPGADPTSASTRPVATARVETRPLEGKGALAPVVVATPTATSTATPTATPAPALTQTQTLPPPTTASTAVAPTPAIAASAATASPPQVAAIALPAAPRDGDDEVNWAWPSAGGVVTSFDDSKVKGLDFGGKAGDPVLAAADGRVVYAGSGLRGYGNLIILKHNSTYLTAYAHNQALLVKEDQTVRRGQKIAEMGSTDADGVQLHFEIRRQGKPIDPARLLPPR